MREELRWQLSSYLDLRKDEFYEIIRLRLEVFVVEQTCWYQDLDGRDPLSYHIMGWSEDHQLFAYSRVVPKSVIYQDYASIGRIVTAPEARGKGYGIQLVKNSILNCRTLFGHVPIKISAQFRLCSFYEQFGFRRTGDIYDEDGIAHIAMILHSAPRSAGSELN